MLGLTYHATTAHATTAHATTAHATTAHATTAHATTAISGLIEFSLIGDMKMQQIRGRSQLQGALIWGALLLPLGLYGACILGRPARRAIAAQPLFRGITYSRRILDRPRPQVIHLLAIDLTAPGLRPFVTPGFVGARPNRGEIEGYETLALRTSRFLQQQGLQVAVNANFFYPFREETLWNYEPREGAQVNLVGLAISDGAVVGVAEPSRPALCFLPQRAEIGIEGDCPAGTAQAVAGNTLLLSGGQRTAAAAAIMADPQEDKPYPVVIAALSAHGEQLWLLLGDGKQPFYSEGLTLGDLLPLLEGLGAETALRLDGGGSTTLAVERDGAPRILNAVIHSKVPGQERPVANHLGFFAMPLANGGSD